MSIGKYKVRYLINLLNLPARRDGPSPAGAAIRVSARSFFTARPTGGTQDAKAPSSIFRSYGAPHGGIFDSRKGGFRWVCPDPGGKIQDYIVWLMG